MPQKVTYKVKPGCADFIPTSGLSYGERTQKQLKMLFESAVIHRNYIEKIVTDTEPKGK